MITGQLNWNIDTEGLTLFEEISPNAGDPLCLCSKCSQVIGASDNDPAWDLHDEDSCIGCDTCTPPIRLWKTLESGDNVQIVGEYRFHKSCFDQVTGRGTVH